MVRISGVAVECVGLTDLKRAEGRFNGVVRCVGDGWLAGWSASAAFDPNQHRDEKGDSTTVSTRVRSVNGELANVSERAES